MLIRTLALGLALICCAQLAFAQQELIGTYVGHWTATYPGHDFHNSGTLKIISVENGKVAGRFQVNLHACAADYPIEGRYQDNKLELQTGEGSMRGCGNQPLVLAVQGTTLVGKYVTFDIKFSKK